VKCAAPPLAGVPSLSLLREADLFRTANIWSAGALRLSFTLFGLCPGIFRAGGRGIFIAAPSSGELPPPLAQKGLLTFTFPL